ncbi:hypothetical protein G3O06_01680 [Burkholderia sp. Ac-20345]|uniref:hypothetical protein n=1 Tax=Burkholderia sp. Ac-20345 TaxID=2703891 RepID=UPI00197C27EA|nr:hypothetical protein [Burkholderia sp. Ac-20345]MBN3776272.1 hypothetical protein [Burkholderia sp. Ac-20345]
MSAQVTEFNAEIVTLGKRASKFVKWGALAGVAAAVSAGLAVYFGLKAHWAVPVAVITSLDIPQTIIAHISDAVPSGGDGSAFSGSPLSGALESMASMLTGVGEVLAPLSLIVGLPMIFLGEDGGMRVLGKLAVGVGILLTAPMLMFSMVGGAPSSDSAPQMSERQVFMQAVDSLDTKWLREAFAKPSTVADQYVLAQLAVIDRSADHLGAFAQTMSRSPESLQHAGLTPRLDVAYAIDEAYFKEPRSNWAKSYVQDAMGRVRRFKSWEDAQLASCGILLAIALGLLGFGKSITARLRRIDQLQQHTRMMRFSDLSGNQLEQALRLFPSVNNEQPFYYVLDDEGNVHRREPLEAVLT